MPTITPADTRFTFELGGQLYSLLNDGVCQWWAPQDEVERAAIEYECYGTEDCRLGYCDCAARAYEDWCDTSYVDPATRVTLATLAAQEDGEWPERSDYDDEDDYAHACEVAIESYNDWS